MNELFTPAVIWFLVGLGLLLLELAIPGFVIIFFGVGAWLTSLGLLFFDFGLNAQLLIFLISSVVLLVLLRRYLKEKFFNAKKDSGDSLDDDIVGQMAVAKTVITPNKQGKIEFKGALWSAFTDEEISEGETVKILDKQSILLKVGKLN